MQGGPKVPKLNEKEGAQSGPAEDEQPVAEKSPDLQKQHIRVVEQQEEAKIRIEDVFVSKQKYSQSRSGDDSKNVVKVVTDEKYWE